VSMSGGRVSGEQSRARASVMRVGQLRASVECRVSTSGGGGRVSGEQSRASVMRVGQLRASVGVSSEYRASSLKRGRV
jgi:hypothetical protein